MLHILSIDITITVIIILLIRILIISIIIIIIIIIKVAEVIIKTAISNIRVVINVFDKMTVSPQLNRLLITYYGLIIMVDYLIYFVHLLKISVKIVEVLNIFFQCSEMINIIELHMLMHA